MAVTKRSARKKSAAELIEEHRQAIKQLEKQHAQEMAKRQEKRNTLLGKAFYRAVTEGFITNKVFTQLASKLIKPSDLEDFIDELPIVMDELQAYAPPPRGRPSPKKVKRTMRSRTPILTEPPSEQEEREDQAEAAEEKKEKTPVMTRPSKTKEAAGGTKITRQRRGKVVSKGQEDRDFSPPEIGEKEEPGDDAGNRAPEGETYEAFDLSQEDVEENEPIPSSVLDTSMPLYRVDAFSRRTRLIDRLSASGIVKLGDLIRRSEKELLKIPNMNMAAVRTCKAILKEMGMDLPK